MYTLGTKQCFQYKMCAHICANLRNMPSSLKIYKYICVCKIEFHPYIFQIIGLLLRLRPTMTEAYASLFDKLLHPNWWKSEGTILAISGIIPDYLEKVDPHKFLTQTRLEGLLGIFQALLATRTQDFYAFRILKCIFQFLPLFSHVLYFCFLRIYV